MKILASLIFVLLTALSNAQPSENDTKIQFETNEFFDVKPDKDGGLKYKAAIVSWTIDILEPAVLIEPNNSEPVVIFFDKEEIKHEIVEEIVVVKIKTEDHDLTILLGPHNFFKVKLMFIKDMNKDGSFSRVFCYTNYPVDNLVNLLSNRHN